jgi:hypothetical protein
MLGELDGYVAARDVHVARKKDQMDALRKLARSTADPGRQFDLEMDIAAEYFPFSFDSTQQYLKHCQELALGPLDDPDRYNEASVLLGHLYAKAGSYLEASQLLYGGIDTTTLSEPLKGEYLWTLYDFSKDLSGNSGMVERLSIPPETSFLPRLYRLLPKDSDRWRSVLRDDLMAAGIPKGKMIGETLQMLLDEVLTDPSKNSREILLDMVRSRPEASGGCRPR